MPHVALTVDDDQNTLLFLEQVLIPLDFHVLQAADGALAIELLEHHTPDILLLDMLLPEISGLDVLKFVLHTPRLNDMYVVVLSAHNRFQASEITARANTFLVKPVRLKIIRDIVQQAMTRQTSP